MISQVSDPLQTASEVYKLMFENDRTRVMKATFKPLDKATMHHHPDHVVYVISGSKIRMTDSDGKTQEMDLKTGDAIFLPAQSHEAQNIGDTVLDLLVVELKK